MDGESDMDDLKIGSFGIKGIVLSSLTILIVVSAALNALLG
jgi:hypothetical protein